MLVDPSRLLPFLVVAVALVIAPGPDFAMTTKNVLRGGRTAGVLTGLGVASGAIVWTGASVLGIVALLRVSSLAFEVVRVLGTIYLVWLGGHSLFAAATGRRSETPAGRKAKPRPAIGETADATSRFAVTPLVAYRQGLLCNLLNPKAAVIYTSVLPQFVVTGDSASLQLATLGAIFVVLIAVWLSFYSTVAAKLTSSVGSRVRRAIDGVTGFILIVLGIRLATD